MSCQFECHEALPLQDANVATHLFRIAQEAVSNAIRHGKATHVNICFDSADNEMVLTITDDGSGLPENTRSGNGMGLRLMAYRADMIGATFNLERLPTHGTRVTCTRPFDPVPNENHVAKN